MSSEDVRLWQLTAANKAKNSVLQGHAWSTTLLFLSSMTRDEAGKFVRRECLTGRMKCTRNAGGGNSQHGFIK